MAHINKVVFSFNSPLGDICVDVFMRTDDTFGFEEYRRDHEDGRGWFPIGYYGAEEFTDAAGALEQAKISVQWLQDVTMTP